MDSDAEAERIFKALSEGGQVTMPMQETFFATRFGQTRDKFGMLWMILHERPMQSGPIGKMKALSQNGLSIHGSSRLLIKGIMSTLRVRSVDFPRRHLLYHGFSAKELDWRTSFSLSSQFCACF